MRKIELEELRTIQLQIADVVDAFCRENNISYWMDSGTLIGAVRHGGYIPWDDDIDFGMTRADYDTFVEKFNASNDRYRCCTIENTRDFPFVFAKVMDTETDLYEPDIKEGIHLGINIDIFPYDNAPSDTEQLRAKYDKVLRNIRWYRRKILPRWAMGSRINKKLRYFLCLPLQIVPRQHFVDRIDETMKQYNDADAEYVSSFGADMIFSCSRAAVDSCIDMDFEGRKYKAPIGYDELLRAQYGDYMQLPPVEKRVSHHHFEAYVRE